MYASFLHKGTLLRRYHLCQSWCKSVCQNLWEKLCKTVYQTYRATVRDPGCLPFLGIRTTWAEFTRLKRFPLSCDRWWKAPFISPFIVFQHCWKKRPIKPSGPDAFSLGSSFMTIAISSSVMSCSSYCKSKGMMFRSSQLRVVFLTSLCPKALLKCECISFSLSLCVTTGPVSVCKTWIWFFLFLPFALRWNSFVLASAVLMLHSLALCFALILSMASSPWYFSLILCLNSLSLCCSSLPSSAVSRFQRMPLATDICNLIFPMLSFARPSVLLWFLRALYVISWMGRLPIGLLQASCTASWNPGICTQ